MKVKHIVIYDSLKDHNFFDAVYILTKLNLQHNTQISLKDIVDVVSLGFGEAYFEKMLETANDSSDSSTRFGKMIDTIKISNENIRRACERHSIYTYSEDEWDEIEKNDAEIKKLREHEDEEWEREFEKERKQAEKEESWSPEDENNLFLHRLYEGENRRYDEEAMP